jgi:hypothetical protein
MKWWLSYADADSFNGAVIVEAETFDLARQRARDVGASPGGKAYGFPLWDRRPEDVGLRVIDDLPLDTLLSIDALREAGIRDMVNFASSMEVADA